MVIEYLHKNVRNAQLVLKKPSKASRRKKRRIRLKAQPKMRFSLRPNFGIRNGEKTGSDYRKIRGEIGFSKPTRRTISKSPSSVFQNQKSLQSRADAL
jgi:hypothetical protein